MTDSVIADGIKLRDRLLGTAKELRIQAEMHKVLGKATQSELCDMDAQVCEESAEMMQKLGTEVTRLRLGIGHFKHGQMSKLDLCKFPNTWNDTGV